MSVVAIANQNDLKWQLHDLPFNSCFKPETQVNSCFNAWVSLLHVAYSVFSIRLVWGSLKLAPIMYMN